MIWIVTDDFHVSIPRVTLIPISSFPVSAQYPSPLPTLWPLPTFPLDWYITYGIGLFWCKEDQNVFLTADTLLTAASLLSQETRGCGGPYSVSTKSYAYPSLQFGPVFARLGLGVSGKNYRSACCSRSCEQPLITNTRSDGMARIGRERVFVSDPPLCRSTDDI
jgi:hypothetical protein